MNLWPFTNRPTKTPWLKSASQTLAFFGAYLIFATVGSAASVACLVPSAVFRRAKAHRIGQRLIHGLFAFFVGYLRRSGLVKLDAVELSPVKDCRGWIFVANHPCLLDAVFIVSELRQVVCLMKGSLVHNIVLCGTANLAGYVNSDSGLGLIRTCQERLRHGSNLLVFPEGTRSIGGELNRFKMGFALVACLAQAPVQTILITADSNYLGKGWPFFRRPPFPTRYSLRLGKRFDPSPGMDARNFGCQVEGYFRSVLTQRSGPSASFPP